MDSMIFPVITLGIFAMLAVLLIPVIADEIRKRRDS
jgi:type II secretory pathway pseudopilin PulG